MPKKSNRSPMPPRLSDAEWIVIKPLWEKGELAARDLYAALPGEHEWTYKTVKTMLGRLVKKGAIDYTQVGNSYLYRACFDREDMVQAAVRSFSRRVLDGALQPFLVNFFDGRRPTKEEISTLREMIEEMEKKGKRKK